MDYVSWQQMGTPHAPYIVASPNVRLIMTELIRKFGGANWGIYVYRAVRGGVQWSTHAWGGAGDWAYQTDEAARLAAIDWLIEHHVALHVQMIVDENYDRTWKSSRSELGGLPGWKNGAINGGPWLHFETTPAGWSDTTPIANRPGIAVPTPTPTPTPTPIDPMEDNMRLIQPTNDAAVFLLDGLTCTWVRDGNVLNALGPLVSPGTISINRLALKALELHGPAPVYSVTPANQPERTVASDFAAHRP